MKTDNLTIKDSVFPKNNHQRRDGMALVMVLVFSTMLMMLAGAYKWNLSNSLRRNESFIDTARAEFAAKSAEQLALLKFREITSDFYFAIKRSDVAANTAKPRNNPDTWFQGTVNVANLPLMDFIYDMDGAFNTVTDVINKNTNGPGSSQYNATFSVYAMYVLSSSEYEEDGLVIRSTVNYTRKDGKVINRDFDSIVRLNRL